MKQEQLWNEYKKINPEANSYEAWSFGVDATMLAKLVVEGKKTATSSGSVFYEIENCPLPQVGAYSIILDENESALCIIQTTKVYQTPFMNVSSEHALKEGEGDRSLAYWRESHKEFFTNVLKEVSLSFEEQMMVVCEEFEVVYKRG